MEICWPILLIHITRQWLRVERDEVFHQYHELIYFWNGNVMEYDTKRGILLVDNFILKFTIYFWIKNLWDLRADATKKKKQPRQEISRKSVKGTCTYYIMVLIQFVLVGHRNRRTNFLIITNMAFSSRFFIVNISLNLQRKKMYNQDK